MSSPPSQRADKLVEAARWLLRNGDAPGARNIVQQALTLDPEHASAQSLLHSLGGAPPKPQGANGHGPKPEQAPTPVPLHRRSRPGRETTQLWGQRLRRWAENTARLEEPVAEGLTSPAFPVATAAPTAEGVRAPVPLTVVAPPPHPEPTPPSPVELGFVEEVLSGDIVVDEAAASEPLPVKAPEAAGPRREIAVQSTDGPRLLVLPVAPSAHPLPVGTPTPVRLEVVAPPPPPEPTPLPEPEPRAPEPLLLVQPVPLVLEHTPVEPDALLPLAEPTPPPSPEALPQGPAGMVGWVEPVRVDDVPEEPLLLTQVRHREPTPPEPPPAPFRGREVPLGNWTLTVTRGPYTGCVYRFHTRRTVALGRRVGDVLFPEDPYVSDRHALLYVSENGLVVMDQHSASGVFVSLRDTELIPPGGCFSVGEHLLRFVGLIGIRDGDHAVFGSPWPARPTYTLEDVLVGDRPGASYALSGPATLGRVGCDLNFPESSQIADRHCFLRPTEEGLLVTDLSTEGVTFVRVRGGERVLSTGARLRVGRQELVVDYVPWAG